MGGMALWHAPGQFSSKVVSVDTTLLLVYILVLAFAVTVSIYYSALKMILIYKIYTIGTIVIPYEL